MSKSRHVQGGYAVPVAITAYEVLPPSAPGDVDRPAANTAAVITYGAPPSSTYHVISGVAWSYDGQLAGGLLQILSGAGVIFEIDIMNAGPDHVPFNPPRRGSAGTAMTVRLAAGGGGVRGRLNVLGHWIERPA